MNVHAVGRKAIVRFVPVPETTEAGVITGGDDHKEFSRWATVLGVGPDVMSFGTGDEVLVSSWAGFQIDDGRRVVHELDAIASRTPETA